jgi:O-antigen/teichoic acid export membrane protein
MSLLRAGAIYGVANALSAAVPFLLLPVLTRALGPAEYGLVVGFFLLVNYASALAGLSVHSAISVGWFRRGPGDEFPALVGSALLVALVTTLACAALMTIVGAIWHETVGLPTWLWPAAALLAGTTAIAAIRPTLWQSQVKPMRSATFQVAMAVGNLGLSLVAVLALATGAAGRIGGALIATVVAALASVALLHAAGDARWQASPSAVRSLLRFGLPLAPHVLAGSLLATADRFTVSARLGADALGIYGAAAQLGMVMNMLGDTLVKVLSPWMYAQMAARFGRARLRIVGATYVLIPVWIAIALLLWAAMLVVGPALLGPRFQAAVGLSIFFLLGGAMSSIYLNIAGLFFFTSKNEWLSIATICSATIAVVLAIVLTKRFGAAGAAAAYLGAQTVQLALSWLLSTRVQPMPWHRPWLSVRALARTRTASP